jgi:hypothetical protein
MTTHRHATLRLPDHWDGAQAIAVLELIDLLRDHLCDMYLPQMQRYLRETQTTVAASRSDPDLAHSGEPF